MGARIAGALALAVAAVSTSAWSQVPSPRIAVRVTHDTVAIPGALVRWRDGRVETDASGTATIRAAAGLDTVTVTKIGFRPHRVAIMLRAGADTDVTIDLTPQAAVVAPVLVSSTRVERRLEAEPLRIEVLGGDDVGEKSEMRPADSRTLLSEMSGVRVQTRSPLGATNIRIEGLPGRYTQILNDGLPLYGGQASSFTLVDVVPLDLRQAEVIKGAASALYGPQALGGVVNLISRRPPDTSQVLVNQSAPMATDLMTFVSRTTGTSWSGSLLAGAHAQRAEDLDDDGWTNVAGARRVEARPRVFWNDGAGHSMMFTVGGFGERRSAGGRLPPPVAQSTPFADNMTTMHGDGGVIGQWRTSDATSFASRLSWSGESRRHSFGDALSRDTRQMAYGELSGTRAAHENTLVAGMALARDAYGNRDVPRFDATYTTPGLFVQDTYAPTTILSGTLNARCDWSTAFGTICSPRLSVLVRPGASSAWTARVSAGSGWFAPRPLTDETETFDLSRVFVPRALTAERGRTLSLDMTGTRGPLQVNATLFSNRVKNPVGIQRLVNDTVGRVNVVNAPGPLDTHGAELFAVYDAEPVVATAYYAVTRSREVSAEDGRIREFPLTPRETAGLDFALEDDESGAYAALEVFYTGRQALEDDPYATISRPYTTVGVLLAKQLGRGTVFVNGENLTSVEMTRYEPFVRPRAGDGGRWTVDAWAPLEARRVNAGVKWRL